MMTQYNDITRFFRINLSTYLNAALLSLVFLISCQSGSVERHRNGNDRFKTTAPSFIYFKNIKSLKYQSNRDLQTQMDLYRPKAFMKSTNQPIIYPVIVHNWLEDESYLTFEKKNMVEVAEIRVEMVPGDTILLNWPDEDYLEQFVFVQKLEKYLREGKNMLIEAPDNEISVLKYSSQQRTSFAAVIQDFLNLTETASSRAKK